MKKYKFIQGTYLIFKMQIRFVLFSFALLASIFQASLVFAQCSCCGTAAGYQTEAYGGQMYDKYQPPPVVTCANDITVVANVSPCSASLVLNTPSVFFTVCPGPFTGPTNPHPPIYALGTTAVTWTVTTLDGKTSTCIQNITVVNNLSLSTGTTHVTCNGINNGTTTAIVADGVPPYNYFWSNGATNSSLASLSAGTYTVTVTDANECTKTASAVVTQPDALVTSGTPVNLVCRGVSTGSISMFSTGGTPPYTYLWNNGSTNQNRSGLSSGTYTVTVKDVNLCTSTASFTITQPATVLLINTSKVNVRCAGGLTGSITASAAGGVAPYSYSWNTIPVKTTASITGLAAGVYICTITDAAGCIKVVSLSITQPPTLSVVQTQTNVTMFNGNDGTASVSVSGGTPGYTYSWNTVPVNTTSSITGLIAGVYKCTVKDSKSCQKKVTFTITQPLTKEQNILISRTDELKLFVYPNPTHGLLKISITGQSKMEYMRLSLFDIAGRYIYNNDMLWSIDEEKQFDFSTLPKGVYYIKCVTEKHNFIEKIVIQ